MSEDTAIQRAVREIPERTVHALAEFFRLEAAGGILLIAAALLALVCANSPLEELYDGFRAMPVAVVVGDFQVAHSMLHWINDGLMAVFFLLVALEIKREMLSGQLSSFDQVLLPMLCALAGVVVPASIYWLINRADPVAMQGWAVPAATDIAFALGILSLLGKRVPTSMKLLLSTIAVVDDLIAILIIAVFFSADLSLTMLAWGGAAVAMMALLNRRGVTALTPYLLLGAVVWVCMLKSGVHATLAGVITGLLIPHRTKHAPVKRAVDQGETSTTAEDTAAKSHPGNGSPADSHSPPHSPLETLEHALHPWIAYAILPVFAFANAGLALGDFKPGDVLDPVPLGVALGLLLGKPIGVFGAAWLGRKSGLVRYPEGMDGKAMIGLGLLCGIGFTMSLFIGSLAFSAEGDLAYTSVLGVLCASVLAAVAGYCWLRVVLPAQADAGPSGAGKPVAARPGASD